MEHEVTVAQAIDITNRQISQALQIYWRHAWPEGSGVVPALPEFKRASVATILRRFTDETGVTPHACRRHVLRLGNHLYPHMKFALEQCVFGGGFYFLADCHDDAIVPTGDQADSWHELRARNFEIKLAIESAWEQAGLPTFRTASRDAPGSFSQRSKTRAARKRTGESGRILIVDDQPAAAELTGAMLRAEGFGTETAGSGADALKSVTRKRPDLVVSDYEMPGLTGRDVAQQLKSDTRTREIPVLICTYADVADSDLHPADAVLRRPFSKEDLSVAVGRLLKRRRR
jgi:CheY-like chemotaxis protein